MNASGQYELWLALLRGELTEHEAAARAGLSLAAVRRIRHVAEQGALAALAQAPSSSTAQVGVSPGAAGSAAERVLDLLVGSAEFVGVAHERIEAIARAATLVGLDERTPIVEGVMSGPVFVADGALLVVDDEDRPVDLIGAGTYRAPHCGRRLVPIGPTAVAALPADAVADAGVVARSRLAAGAPLGGPPRSDAHLPAQLDGVLGDLLAGPEVRVWAHESIAEVAQRVSGGRQAVVVETRGRTPFVLRGETVRRAADAARVDQLASASLVGPTTPSLTRRTPIISALACMLGSGSPVVVVTDILPGEPAQGDARIIGAVTVEDLPLPQEARLQELFTWLSDTAEPSACTVERFQGVAPAARQMARSSLVAGADVADVGRLLAAVTDQLMRRLLLVAVRELGPPPGPFAWLVFGSQARREPGPDSDQDTGLVHASGLGAEDRAWYARLGEWMTDAVERCGYPRCPGGVVASRGAWRHDLEGWEATGRAWADPTETAGLVGVDIGLDVRAVAGQGELATEDVAERLGRMIADVSRRELTLARLARAAVARRPPSGVWGKVGQGPLGPPLRRRPRRFDVKRQGIQPIVDLARLHTLRRGGAELHTCERLASAAQAGWLGVDLAATLVEGHRLLTWTRMSGQLAQPPAGAHGHVDWDELPGPLRDRFSETFAAIRSAQSTLRSRYRLAAGG